MGRERKQLIACGSLWLWPWPFGGSVPTGSGGGEEWALRDGGCVDRQWELLPCLLDTGSSSAALPETLSSYNPSLGLLSLSSGHISLIL